MKCSPANALSQARAQLSVASAILEKDPAPISSSKPLTPPVLDHAIRRCLAKDPEERWGTPRDLALELRWMAEAGTQIEFYALASPRKTGRQWGRLGRCGSVLYCLGAQRIVA